MPILSNSYLYFKLIFVSNFRKFHHSFLLKELPETALGDSLFSDVACLYHFHLIKSILTVRSGILRFGFPSNSTLSTARKHDRVGFRMLLENPFWPWRLLQQAFQPHHARSRCFLPVQHQALLLSSLASLWEDHLGAF
jgi:hypothetical protein